MKVLTFLTRVKPEMSQAAKLLKTVFGVLLFTLLSFSTAFADLARSGAQGTGWRKNVTYEEFEWVLRSKVWQIPDLQNLWQYTATYPHMQTKTFFGGGALRGLIEWTAHELEHRSAEAVIKLPAPSIDQLIIKGADRDIFLTKDARKEWLPVSYQNNWDILAQDFLTNSLLAGGSEIEKIGVAPNAIHDPNSALRKYYNGRIDFIDSPESFFQQYRSNNSSTGLRGNSKTALLLRHLRFLVQFDDVEITAEDIALFKKVVESETDLLERDNYWIKKSLGKLETQAQKSKRPILPLLAEIGLDRLLEKYGYTLTTANIREFRLKAMADNPKLDFNQISQFKLASGSIAEIKAMMLANFKKVNTAAEMIELFSPGIANPSIDYLKELNSLWLSKAKDFAALSPTPEETQIVTRKFSHAGTVVGLKKDFLPTARTAAEFIEILAPGVANPSNGYLEELNGLWRLKIKDFIALNPTPQQMKTVKRKFGNVQTLIELNQLFVSKAKTAAEFIDIMTPEVEYPSNGYLEQLNGLWLNKAKDFAALNPTPEQIQTVKRKFGSVQGLMELNRAFLPKAKTAADLIGIISSEVSSPSDAYRIAIDQLWVENFKRFLSLKPSAQEIEKVRKSLAYQNSLNEFNELVAQAQTPTMTELFKNKFKNLIKGNGQPKIHPVSCDAVFN
jgi:hypothetical protein